VYLCVCPTISTALKVFGHKKILVYVIGIRVELLPDFEFNGKMVNKLEFTGKIGKTGKR
jgi:hypothetical protein